MSASRQGQTEASTQSLERTLVHMPTVDTYDRWAATYDSDGNILQALDTLALQQQMFPFLFEKLLSKTEHSQRDRPFPDGDTLYLTDLGCGTGRADLLLLSALRSSRKQFTDPLALNGCHNIYLTGVDASTGMLEVAHGRVPAKESVGDNVSFQTRYGSWDIYSPENKPQWVTTESTTEDEFVPAHVVISTLVLEHLEIDVYFQSAKKLLRSGGLFLVTNMHSDMGTMVFGDPLQYKGHPLPTGAGFVDTTTNTKIRAAKDYAHTMDEVIEGAKREGFELLENRTEELTVEPWMLERGSQESASNGDSTPLLGVRGKKWVGTKCWYGMIFRLQT